jgi:translation initiation factor IF-3
MQKKKQKKTTVKTSKYRPGTEEGDYQIKFRNLVKFLDNGDKVKVSIWFRGREMQHKELCMKMLDRIEKDTEEFAINPASFAIFSASVVLNTPACPPLLSIVRT